jgi:hypothetical protein
LFLSQMGRKYIRWYRNHSTGSALVEAVVLVALDQGATGFGGRTKNPRAIAGGFSLSTKSVIADRSTSFFCRIILVENYKMGDFLCYPNMEKAVETNLRSLH